MEGIIMDNGSVKQNFINTGYKKTDSIAEYLEI
jgi:hypothetical protein